MFNGDSGYWGDGGDYRKVVFSGYGACNGGSGSSTGWRLGESVVAVEVVVVAVVAVYGISGKIVFDSDLGAVGGSDCNDGSDIAVFLLFTLGLDRQ